MAFKVKGLWVEDLDNGSARVIQHVKATGANLVCIRTTAAALKGLIPTFHNMGVKIYGWRWPHVYASGPNDSALWSNEMNHVANDLIPAGLDGYIFDIESDEQKQPKDWDNPDYKNQLPQIATDFTTGLKKAFDNRGTPYLLGLTSHARGFSIYPGIPWQPFLNVCSVLYPQTYWRFNKGTVQHKICVDENADPATHHGAGTPDQALKNGFNDYGPKNKPLVPVGGEMGCAKPGEMTTFGKLVAARGLTEAHFYVDVDDNGMDPSVLQEMKAL